MHVHIYRSFVKDARTTDLVAAVEGAGLAGHGLDEHADGHAGGEGVLFVCLFVVTWHGQEGREASGYLSGADCIDTTPLHPVKSTHAPG